jgi:hypothetical protein
LHISKKCSTFAAINLKIQVMKKILLFVVMVFSVNYLYAYDYFSQSVGILSADVTTGKSLFYNNVSLKIGISDNKFYLSLDKGSMSEAITFYVDNVDQANNKGIIFGSSYAYDYLTMKSAKQNTFRGAAVGLVPVEVDISKFDRNAQGIEETVCIVFQHEQTKTEQKYYIIFKESSSPYNDVLQAFIKTYNKKKSSTNTSQSTMNKPAYIDLGLPSGTLWRSSNEEGLYTFDEAVKKFGNKLPSIKQIDELVKSCTWTFDGKSNSMRATGPNGEYILFPMDGYVSCQGIEYGKYSKGCYWSSKKYGDDYAQWLKISLDTSELGRYINQQICISQSVRLVQYSK